MIALPPVMGVIGGAIPVSQQCEVPGGWELYLFAYFVLFPFVVAGLGSIAGRTTWSPRGPGWALLGALAGAFLGFAWGAVAFWTTAITISDTAGC